MARETDIVAVDPMTLYEVIRRQDNGHYVKLDLSNEVFDATHWSSYVFSIPKIVLQAGVSAQYTKDFPHLPQGIYYVDIYAQAAGSPSLLADGLPRFSGTINWTGTAEANVPVISSRVRVTAGILVRASVGNVYSRQIDLPRTLLSLISTGSSVVVVQGAIAAGSPTVTLFNDTITSSVASKIDITNYSFIVITVNSGSPVVGNMS